MIWSAATPIRGGVYVINTIHSSWLMHQLQIVHVSWLTNLKGSEWAVLRAKAHWVCVNLLPTWPYRNTRKILAVLPVKQQYQYCTLTSLSGLFRLKWTPALSQADKSHAWGVLGLHSIILRFLTDSFSNRCNSSISTLVYFICAYYLWSWPLGRSSSLLGQTVSLTVWICNFAGLPSQGTGTIRNSLAGHILHHRRTHAHSTV